jgi:hypothetical protein
MIRRFMAFLFAPRFFASPATSLCRVQTDFDHALLHSGDSILVERGTGYGFVVVAYVLRDCEFQSWPLYFCENLRGAEDLCAALKRALAEGARDFSPVALVAEEVSR